MNTYLLGRGFIAGAVAVLVFHQVALWVLNLLGLVPVSPWSFAPTAPFGVPAVISAAFWGGLWGVLLVAVAPSVARSPGLAALFGAVFPTLVAWFVVLPLKGLPAGNGFTWPGILVGPIVNGAWGLGLAYLLRGLERQGRRPARAA